MRRRPARSVPAARPPRGCRAAPARRCRAPGAGRRRPRPRPTAWPPARSAPTRPSPPGSRTRARSSASPRCTIYGIAAASRRPAGSCSRPAGTAGRSRSGEAPSSTPPRATRPTSSPGSSCGGRARAGAAGRGGGASRAGGELVAALSPSGLAPATVAGLLAGARRGARGQRARLRRGDLVLGAGRRAARPAPSRSARPSRALRRGAGARPRGGAAAARRPRGTGRQPHGGRACASTTCGSRPRRPAPRGSSRAAGARPSSPRRARRRGDVLRVALLLGELDLLAFGPAVRAAPAPPPLPAGAAPDRAEHPGHPRGAAAPTLAAALASARRPAAGRTGRPAARGRVGPARRARRPLTPAALRALEERLQRADHFAALGVKPDAPAAQIKTAYFQLASLYHPDAVPSEAPPEVKKLCSDVFAKVSEAWSVLGEDPAARATSRGSGPAAPPRWTSSGILRGREVFETGMLFVRGRRNYEEARAEARRGHRAQRRRGGVRHLADLVRLSSWTAQEAPGRHRGHPRRRSGETRAASRATSSWARWRSWWAIPCRGEPAPARARGRAGPRGSLPRAQVPEEVANPEQHARPIEPEEARPHAVVPAPAHAARRGAPPVAGGPGGEGGMTDAVLRQLDEALGARAREGEGRDREPRGPLRGRRRLAAGPACRWRRCSGGPCWSTGATRSGRGSSRPRAARRRGRPPRAAAPRGNPPRADRPGAGLRRSAARSAGRPRAAGPRSGPAQGAVRRAGSRSAARSAGQPRAVAPRSGPAQSAVPEGLVRGARLGGPARGARPGAAVRLGQAARAAAQRGDGTRLGSRSSGPARLGPAAGAPVGISRPAHLGPARRAPAGPAAPEEVTEGAGRGRGARIFGVGSRRFE